MWRFRCQLWESRVGQVGAQSFTSTGRWSPKWTLRGRGSCGAKVHLPECLEIELAPPCQTSSGRPGRLPPSRICLARRVRAHRRDFLLSAQDGGSSAPTRMRIEASSRAAKPEREAGAKRTLQQFVMNFQEYVPTLGPSASAMDSSTGLQSAPQGMRTPFCLAGEGRRLRTRVFSQCVS